MIFKLTITPNATEIRHKVMTATGVTPVRVHSRVLLMSVLALATRSPRIHIEPFASGQPPLAELFWPARDKSEGFAGTGEAVRRELGFFKFLVVVFE